MTLNCEGVNKNGRSCRKPPLRNQRFCVNHGGVLPEPEVARELPKGIACSFLARRLSPNERRLLPRAHETIGSVDSEIAIAKVVLNRLLIAQKLWERQRAGPVDPESGFGFVSEMCKLMNTIATLEQARAVIKRTSRNEE